MALTYEPLATTTLTGTAGTVTFSSISSAYTDLILVCYGKSSATTGVGLQFNGDTGTNYSAIFAEGNGTAVSSARQTSNNYLRVAYNSSWTSGGAGSIIVQINNYSNSTTYKSVLARADKSDGAIGVNTGLWRSPSAINRIDVTGLSQNFASGAVFSLYGIKAA